MRTVQICRQAPSEGTATEVVSPVAVPSVGQSAKEPALPEGGSRAPGKQAGYLWPSLNLRGGSDSPQSEWF
jgi:hypothetical protein